MALLRLADEEFVLLLTLHHIASDGWSRACSGRELSALYAAYARGQPSPLPELPLQYADFAVWQRAWLQGEVLKRQLDYWRTQLRDLTPLELPADRPRPPQPSYRGASLTSQCRRSWRATPPAEPRRERDIAHDAAGRLPGAAGRYSGQEDIAVGMPIAGRRQAELEHLIGFFVNTLVLRTDLSGQPTFRELLARVRRMSLDAYEHQDLPFEKLVEELSPSGTSVAVLCFRSCFNCSIFPKSARPAGTWTWNALPSPGGRVRFDLEMHLWTQPDQGLRGSVVYSTGLVRGGDHRAAGRALRDLAGGDRGRSGAGAFRSCRS